MGRGIIYRLQFWFWALLKMTIYIDSKNFFLLHLPFLWLDGPTGEILTLRVRRVLCLLLETASFALQVRSLLVSPRHLFSRCHPSIGLSIRCLAPTSYIILSSV